MQKSMACHTRLVLDFFFIYIFYFHIFAFSKIFLTRLIVPWNVWCDWKVPQMTSKVGMIVRVCVWTSIGIISRSCLYLVEHGIEVFVGSLSGLRFQYQWLTACSRVLVHKYWVNDCLWLHCILERLKVGFQWCLLFYFT